ncbi:MAG: Uma2 family endonuclease [Pyrinomonadaceae bacterium]|nr:Uma2 family endonuclease [Pyrinomonadaceae bacterium]
MSQQTLLEETTSPLVDFAPPSPVILNIQSLGLSEEQFELLCRDNRDLRIELTAKGELVIMPPTGMKTGWRNGKLTQRFGNWAEEDGTGICFDSSTLFRLPNGAKRSPDVSWIKRERVEALTEKEQESFAAICPDFVLELRSPSDAVSFVQQKMQEYMVNGAQLGWMIDPFTKRVYIYRPNQSVEILEDPETVMGDPVLPGFVLHVREIW